ncbi:MAG: hypothetical protein WCX61_00135 [Candidatus Peribacteraceae bacterium]|jgi:hypothetical protein
MTSAQKTVTTLGLLLILLGFGAADAVLTTYTSPGEEPVQVTPEPPVIADDDVNGAQTETPQVGVQTAQGPNVLETLMTQGFTFKETTERTLISLVVTNDTPVHTRVILANNDRIGLIAWTESPRVKMHFLALKEALHSAFSPQITDLVDETKQLSGRPTQNLLTFRDPAISEERLVFVRVRDRLYEFHIAPNNDDAIFLIIEELTR